MASYTGGIVDVDVHHRPKTASELAAYLPARWRELVENTPNPSPTLAPPGITSAALIEHGAVRADAISEPGVTPGYDFDVFREQVMDKYGYHRAVLTFDVGEWPAHANQYYARDICRAANDWTAETWLPRDERLVTVIAAPTADPLAAAEEIRRKAEDPRFVAVLFGGNPLGRPLGDPVYHPIFDAAAEAGLPITVHPGTDRPNPMVGSVGGPPATAMEYASQLTQQAMHYVSSLIVHGVFERFPNLHFAIKEYGVTWLPTVMWRLDQEYETLKRESPWVKRLPSEYIREHIRLSTQPIESSPQSGGTAEFLATVPGIEDMLCFSSDFPHYSMDQPGFIARLLPREWHRKVFLENACEMYGWDVPAEAAA